MSEIWIVIAAYNEAPTIGDVVANIRTQGFQNIVVVVDGATDKTSAVAETSGATCLIHSLNLGQGAALQTGIEFALKRGADIVVTFDADGQMDARDIEKVITPILNNERDVVLGSRFLNELDKSMPWTRAFILRAATLYSQLSTGLKITDTHNGFRAFSKQALKGVVISQNRMAHASEILKIISQNKWRYTEVPVRITYTPHTLKKGQKNLSLLNILWELFFKV